MKSAILEPYKIKNPKETFGLERTNLSLKNKNPKRIKTKGKKKAKFPKYSFANIVLFWNNTVFTNQDIEIKLVTKCRNKFIELEEEYYVSDIHKINN